MKSIKTPFKKQRAKSSQSELLQKLNHIEKFHQQLAKEQPKKQATSKLKEGLYSELNYFEDLKTRFSGFHFIVENTIKTSQLRTFGNYFEIFSTYIETLLTPLKRNGLEKSLRVEIKTEFIRNKLQFSVLINNIRFSREDIVSRDLKRTESSTGHLLTPFQGHISHFIKKSPTRQVKAVLVKMEMTPLRQHIPQLKIQNH